jgi:hypothetical protein
MSNELARARARRVVRASMKREEARVARLSLDELVREVHETNRRMRRTGFSLPAWEPGSFELRVVPEETKPIEPAPSVPAYAGYNVSFSNVSYLPCNATFSSVPRGA